MASVTAETKKFQSTLPMRGGTVQARQMLSRNHYFNPPSPCGEGLPELSRSIPDCDISIHPPHAGRDHAGGTSFRAVIGISIHPPHAGRDEADVSVLA